MSNETGVTGQQQRRTPGEVAQIVAQFADSGLNRTEFCRRNGICMSTLNRHLKRQLPGSANRANDGLIAVELADSNDISGSCVVAVVLSRGRRIEVSAGFDAPTLQRLIVLLENM